MFNRSVRSIGLQETMFALAGFKARSIAGRVERWEETCIEEGHRESECMLRRGNGAPEV